MDDFTQTVVAMNNFCEEIGRNPLLVQGAGGNISVKHERKLYVKASGKRLAEANNEDIFVTVDLHNQLSLCEQGDFRVRWECSNKLSNRPSIETILHAVLPQRFVLHLHAINSCQSWFVEHQKSFSPIVYPVNLFGSLFLTKNLDQNAKKFM